MAAGRNTARDVAKEHENELRRRRAAPWRRRLPRPMKKNPVNHRVFERKLRPRDPPEGTPASRALEAHPRSVASGQKDADIGPPNREVRWAQVCGRRMWPGAASGGLLRTPPRATYRHEALFDPLTRRMPPRPALRGAFGPIPQVRRGYPPSLSI
ncbi:hypothetical protein FCM35_KLT00762 [Carex littledalei]|uniref:Uncharacterized protein n=1 Tax=Carex littledalei TaxID=544730 RepID=A0A833S2F8_9POAL|nr:hypothetical protein FCM35_KLT00762 [Carex littledalei]